ncbi:MAG: hypothetical protein IJV89_01555, partial [Lentisphaeria bacterium]|nr:hypothetical protein [Lentisphaeria bacterium]
MSVAIAMTAYKMPLYGIRLPLSAHPASSAAFPSYEKLSCVNDSSRKQASSFAKASEDKSKHPASVALRLYAATRASK